MTTRIALSVLLLALALGGCTRNLAHVHHPPRAMAVPTAFPWSSLVYLARTDEGVVAFDLGWRGAEGAIERSLRAMGADARDVRHVFLTHSHRDHVAGWPALRWARFHLAADEVPLFFGEDGHADFPSRAARWLRGPAGPWRGEVPVTAFSADTAIVLGADTVRAFVVAGHTGGSAAYLFRGILFVGDAVRRAPLRGWRGAHPLFTEDEDESRESLRSLWARVEPYEVEWVCNAHAKCARPDERFLREALR